LSIVRAIFAECDVDGSGYIEKPELKQMLKKLGQDDSDERVDDIFSQMDTDGNGTINFFEFMSRAPREIFINITSDSIQSKKKIAPGKKMYDQEQIKAIRKLFAQYDKGNDWRFYWRSIPISTITWQF
jgi:Ca2+-binding EF-hand superfamily protein